MYSKNKNNNMTNNNFEQIFKNFDKEAEKINLTPSAEDSDMKLVRTTVDRSIERLAAIKQISIPLATVGLCGLLQAGAYLKGVQNRVINFNNVPFDKKELVYALEKAKSTFTLRVIARSIKEEIIIVSRKYQIPGHLFARFKIEHPELPLDFKNNPEALEYAIYCTDFQIDNPNCPQVVRTFLSTRELDRSNRNTNRSK
jgi:UDP:flavonoid glycosyltransferase YjiC (YdhE family)